MLRATPRMEAVEQRVLSVKVRDGQLAALLG
jgi:hypothetical protein